MAISNLGQDDLVNFFRRTEEGLADRGVGTGRAFPRQEIRPFFCLSPPMPRGAHSGAWCVGPVFLPAPPRQPLFRTSDFSSVWVGIRCRRWARALSRLLSERRSGTNPLHERGLLGSTSTISQRHCLFAPGRRHEVEGRLLSMLAFVGERALSLGAHTHAHARKARRPTACNMKQRLIPFSITQLLTQHTHTQEEARKAKCTLLICDTIFTHDTEKMAVSA